MTITNDSREERTVKDEWIDLLARSNVEFQSYTYGNNDVSICIPAYAENKANGGDKWLSVENCFDGSGSLTLFEIS